LISAAFRLGLSTMAGKLRITPGGVAGEKHIAMLQSAVDAVSDVKFGGPDGPTRRARYFQAIQTISSDSSVAHGR
jgi:hypothetical protein